MSDLTTQVVVIGSGPGGYSAAFRAADLGLQVVLVERFANIGGVCLNVGCIPSKSLLHVAKVIAETEHLSKEGVSFGKATIDLNKLRSYKDNIVRRLTSGLKMLAKQRKVKVVQGTASFTSANSIQVAGPEGSYQINFEHAIIACGSRPLSLPQLPEHPRVMDSTGALELADIPEKLLVIGGGIIGLEMATVYHALGSKITVVELFDSLMGGFDQEIIAPLQKRVSKQYQGIYLKTKVSAVDIDGDGFKVSFEGKDAPSEPQYYDAILSSVGRVPNGKQIGAETAGINVDERGFIPVDKQQRTNIEHIFAIGDIVGNPMLAHKAIPEGRVAAEVIAGKKHFFDPKCIASVAYTDPEVAWVGLSEKEAKAANIDYGKGVFPWMASGRALSMGRSEGLTKVLFDNSSKQIIGAAIVGPHAGDLISEVALAIEMGCDAEDISLTVHPHPTLSETVAMATEIFEGTITDLYMPKSKE